MPAHGKHRRPKSLAIPRGLAAAGTGGAALALPLLGAAGAHAAPAAAPAALPVQAPQLPASAQAAPAVTPVAAPGVYTVVPGDCLSQIAADRHLSGGWERLYADNREAVGADPSLIHPGLKLTLGGHGDRTSAKPASRDSGPASVPSSSDRSSGKAQAPSETGSGSASAAERPAAPAAQGSGSASGAVTAAGFVAPVSGGISTPYKLAGSMWSSGYHTGVDFIASTGTTVKAVGAGTVVTAGWGGAYGNEVVIRHADGKYSQYGHLSQLSVSVGQSVTAGQRIGLSGATGNVTGPHLHFEIRTGPSYGSDIDPLAYLRSKGVGI
ncbi:LysM peptidoglycan-binding domain-containing M23 family metallopeptidase [Streptomyces sp. NPDC054883]